MIFKSIFFVFIKFGFFIAFYYTFENISTLIVTYPFF